MFFNNKRKKILENKKRIVFLTNNLILCSDFLFIYSDKKYFLENFSRSSGFKRNDVEVISKIFADFSSSFFGKKIYFKVFEGNGDNFRAVFSKKPIKISSLNNVKIGQMLGYPECCIKKYNEEDDGSGRSINSSMRYLQQIREIGLKDDYFEVNHSFNMGGSKLGFFPCSPKCLKAKKILNEYKRIEKILK